MTRAARTRTQVFISYARKNSKWLERLKMHLNPLVRSEKLDPWDDTRIKAGEKWKLEIAKALDGAKVAVLLVSPEFLASDFIATKELPRLLTAAKKEGLTIIWLYLSECAYKKTWLKHYQAAHDISRPLDGLTPSKRNAELKRICEKIEKAERAPARRPGIHRRA